MKRGNHILKDRDLLLRHLEGSLPPDEARIVQDRLEAEPAFRLRLERLGSMADVLASARADSFAPYFSERVIRRLTAADNRDTSVITYESLRWGFARTALAGLVAAAALGGYNVLIYQGLGVMSSLVEAVFGLPSPSIVDALAIGGA